MNHPEHKSYRCRTHLTKMWIFVWFVIILLLLVGCGSSTDTRQVPESKTTPDSPRTIDADSPEFYKVNVGGTVCVVYDSGGGIDCDWE